MKILYLEAYFKPEKTSGAHLAEDMRIALANAGHSVSVYAPIPSRGVSKEVRSAYKKRKHETELDGAVSIHRFSLFREKKNAVLRAIRYCICDMKLLWFGLTAKNVDICPIGSTPPISGMVGTIITKMRKIPFVYIVQDVFPESLVSTGMTHKGSLLWKIGNWVSNVTYKNAAHIIVISESIKNNLVGKGVPEEKITVIYNWIDTEVTVPVPREQNTLFDEFGLSRDKFYVTYAGNLGNSQNVDLLVNCADKLKDHCDIQFVIFGDGSEKERCKKRIVDSRLENIKLFPMQPPEKISEVYSLGDVSFVTCKKGVGGGAFPSKAATIMATATPVIASFDTDSDLCRIIEEAKVGLCVEPENTEQAANAILKFYGDTSLREECSKNARALACNKFSKENGISKRMGVYEKYALK